MAALDEPEDGSYALVAGRSGVQAFHRDDRLAADLDLPGTPVRHWFTAGTAGVSPTRPATWQELTEMGDVAYVGAFVDRSRRRSQREQDV